MISAANHLQPSSGNNHLLTELNMKRLLFFLTILSSSLAASAQVTDSNKVYRVGIFASLFLDSSFTGMNFKYGNQIPKHILAGLDFVQGSLMALDSVSVTQQVQVSIYDITSSRQTVDQLKKKLVFDSLDLMIGAVNGRDYLFMANEAKRRQIPFISATFPNDAGVTYNPYTIILNATLSVHCETIYNYILENNPTANLVYLRKNGSQEDRLKEYFSNLNKSSTGGAVLKWKEINSSDSVNLLQFVQSLDSTKTNIIITGSLNERFGLQVINLVNGLKNYSIELIGMPTWEPLKELSLPAYKELPILYTTTFFNPTNDLSNNFTQKFITLTNGRPSDLAYKGYEITWNFLNLLLKYKMKVIQNLSDSSFHLFTDYRIKPVFNTTNGALDYYENKRVFMIRQFNGTTSKVN
jgi:hypothetical protein